MEAAWMFQVDRRFGRAVLERARARVMNVFVRLAWSRFAVGRRRKRAATSLGTGGQDILNTLAL